MVKWYEKIPNVIEHLIVDEFKRGTLLDSIIESVKSKSLKLAGDFSFADLLEERVEKSPYKTFVYYHPNNEQKESFTFQEVDESTNQLTNMLRHFGFGPGRGLGIFMSNSVKFLNAYYASQKIGMYAVPINTATVGDGLTYIINHSEIEVLFIDEELLPQLEAIQKDLLNLKKVFINRKVTSVGKPADLKIFENEKYQDMNKMKNFSTQKDKSLRSNPDDISTIMYTSGTTGAPKGVVFRYGNDWVRKFGILANLVYKKDDILYTCLPLFHANALFLSFSSALWLGLPIVLSKKFSASKFWDEINEYKATSFNAIGSMISILMKQPVKESDSQNSIRLVLSAACPADVWEDFEKRFNLQIWEGYSAIDGGAQSTFNMGNAPVGSIGKPLFGKIKIVNKEGREADVNEPGELLFFVGNKNKSSVEYFKNEEASNEKVKNGYIHTGDIVYKDKNGYLYFVGRNTESMRRRGENVSAYEIENVLLKHDKILEVAAYPVPSDLGEDDIMISLVLIDAEKNTERPNEFYKELLKWLDGKLAKYAIPRYIRIVKELPKTATHRVRKKILEKEGITEDTFDSEE